MRTAALCVYTSVPESLASMEMRAESVGGPPQQHRGGQLHTQRNAQTSLIRPQQRGISRRRRRRRETHLCKWIHQFIYIFFSFSLPISPLILLLLKKRKKKPWVMTCLGGEDQDLRRRNDTHTQQHCNSNSYSGVDQKRVWLRGRTTAVCDGSSSRGAHSYIIRCWDIYN